MTNFFSLHGSMGGEYKVALTNLFEFYGIIYKVKNQNMEIQFEHVVDNEPFHVLIIDSLGKLQIN